MVANLRKCFLLFSIWSIFSLSACKNDILGIFGSTDLDIRWQSRNTFNFLSASDLNISLGDEYSFIVIGDTHIEDGDINGLYKLNKLINDDIKFVVFNGDITQNGKREDILAYIDIARSLGVPCYPVVGNHDIYFGNWPEWKELIGSTCYRVNGDSATLFMMDSANAYFGDKQLDWLEDGLNKANNGRVFVFSHVNLFAKNPTNLQHFTDTRERAWIMSLLKGRGDAMFMGHVHQRIVNELGGVWYITIEDFHDNDTYCQVWVSQNGIRWEFKRL